MEQRYFIDNREIGARVKAARKRLGLTQGQVAERIELSENAVAKLENGFMAASLQTLVKLANELGVTMEYFLAADAREPGEAEDLARALLQGLDRREAGLVIKVISALRVYFAEK